MSNRYQRSPLGQDLGAQSEVPTIIRSVNSVQSLNRPTQQMVIGSVPASEPVIIQYSSAKTPPGLQAQTEQRKPTINSQVLLSQLKPNPSPHNLINQIITSQERKMGARPLGNPLSPQMLGGQLKSPMGSQTATRPLNTPPSPQMSSGQLKSPMSSQMSTRPLNTPPSPQILTGPLKIPMSSQMPSRPVNTPPSPQVLSSTLKSPASSQVLSHALLTSKSSNPINIVSEMPGNRSVIQGMSDGQNPMTSSHFSRTHTVMQTPSGVPGGRSLSQKDLEVLGLSVEVVPDNENVFATSTLSPQVVQGPKQGFIPSSSAQSVNPADVQFISPSDREGRGQQISYVHKQFVSEPSRGPFGQFSPRDHQ